LLDIITNTTNKQFLMKFNKTFYSFLILLFSFSIKAQNYLTPLDIPIILSSNFGELRKDHFHSGIDIKTHGITGYPVRAIEDGYISRIRISTGGYGRVLYIDHPDGNTSVYAHLSKFSPKLQKFVEQKQIAMQMNEFEMYFAPNFLAVKKGEILAFSGNSGHSGGPHLHFEIRDTKTEEPLNPLKFYPQIVDKRPPIAQSIVIYNLSDSVFNPNYLSKELPLYFYHHKYIPNSSAILNVSENFSVAVRALDKMTNSPNRFGVYKLQLLLDDSLRFEIIYNRLSFAEQKGVNALMDYPRFISANKKMYRLFKLPNNDLMIYNPNYNGIMHLSDSKIHTVKILLFDINNNKSLVQFKVKLSKHKINIDNEIYSYKQKINFQSPGVKVFIPSYAFFSDYKFRLITLNSRYSKWSKTYKVASASTPLKKSIIVHFDISQIPANLYSKIYAIRTSPKNLHSSQKGNVQNHIFELRTSKLGKFYLDLDTIPPKTYLLTKKIFKSEVLLKFKIIEKGVGLHSYDVYYNNQWIPAYYDSKFRVLNLHLKPAVNKGKLKIVLTDKLANKSEFNFNL